MDGLGARLADIVGTRRVLERPGELRSYESDGLPGYQCTPSLAVFPGTREETIAVVRALAETGTSFVARGAGTGLSGGALAEGVVLLGLHRLKRIISLDGDNMRAVVEPGVVNSTTPPPPPSTACTTLPIPPARARAPSVATWPRTREDRTASSMASR